MKQEKKLVAEIKRTAKTGNEVWGFPGYLHTFYHLW